MHRGLADEEIVSFVTGHGEFLRRARVPLVAGLLDRLETLQSFSRDSGPLLSTALGKAVRNTLTNLCFGGFCRQHPFAGDSCRDMSYFTRVTMMNIWIF